MGLALVDHARVAVLSRYMLWREEKTPSGTDRLPWIDALRGLAVLGVIAVHAADRVPGTEGWMQYGARGVQLFFFVSAFTLMTSADRRHETVAFFLIRRFFRIAPMFYAATIFYAVSDNSSIVSIGATLSLLFGLTPWTLAQAVVPGAWSVGAEVLFYAAFPYVARRSNALLAVIGIMVLGSIGDMATTKFASLMMPATGSEEWLRSEWWIWYMVATWASAFPAGMLFFHLLKATDRSQIFALHDKRKIEIILGIVLLYLAWRLSHFENDIVPIVLVFIPMGFCLALGAGRWVANPPLRWLGKISFSCYLIHFVMLGPAYKIAALLSLNPRGTLSFTFLLALAMTAICSSITYVLIERPFIAMGESVIRSLQIRSSMASMTRG